MKGVNRPIMQVAREVGSGRPQFSPPCLGQYPRSVDIGVPGSRHLAVQIQSTQYANTELEACTPSLQPNLSPRFGSFRMSMLPLPERNLLCAYTIE